MLKRVEIGPAAAQPRPVRGLTTRQLSELAAVVREEVTSRRRRHRARRRVRRLHVRHRLRRGAGQPRRRSTSSRRRRRRALRRNVALRRRDPLRDRHAPSAACRLLRLERHELFELMDEQPLDRHRHLPDARPPRARRDGRDSQHQTARRSGRIGPHLHVERDARASGPPMSGARVGRLRSSQEQLAPVRGVPGADLAQLAVELEARVAVEGRRLEACRTGSARARTSAS